MTQYTFSFDLPSNDEIKKIVDGAVLPRVTQAVHAIAQQARINWQDAVMRARLWNGEKAPYAASIKVEMTGAFSAVVSSDYRYADEIENGRPPRDLKKMLDTSTKVRRTRDGRRFLVIPFRHNTPGNDALAPAMPTDVYQMAKGLSASSITGSGTRPSGEVTILSRKSGMRAANAQTPYLSHIKNGGHYLVNKSNYAWGSKLSPAMLHAQSKGVRAKYAGLTRFKTSTGGSSYLTFRIMMEGSTGWIVSAQPGKYLARKVADALGPLAAKAMTEALKRSTY
ncbi:MAG TPA: hypothetical protein VF450_19535 [Noviherbaspirillum sp.]